MKTFWSKPLISLDNLQGVKGERGFPGPIGDKGDEVSRIDWEKDFVIKLVRFFWHNDVMIIPRVLLVFQDSRVQQVKVALL